MLLYRSFVVGLLGACCLLLAARPRPEVRLIAPPQPVAVNDAPAIVDVSAQIDPVALAQLLHVPPGAQVFASGPSWSYADTFVARSEDLAPMLAQRMPRAGNFIELTVNGHRMLVLAH
jgi:hypothetical protein